MYYSKDEIKKAKQIDLYTYLTEKEPDEIIPFSRGTYIIREHDSLKISNGMWYWFSKGVGGKSALDYLIIVKGYSFTEAMNTILNYDIEIPKYEFKKKTEVELQLPEKNSNNDRVIYYLKSRGIDEDIIKELINKDLIYEVKNNHNVVFVGLDEKKNPKFASIRATNKSRYMHDAYGSNKAYSFKLESFNKSDTVHIFESAIDLLSYATLLKMNNIDYHEFNLLSLAGVYQPSKDLENSKRPIALSLFLNNHKIKKVILHLDNDNAGRMATIGLTHAIGTLAKVIDEPPKYGKDYNDYLCYIKSKNKERRNEYEL